MFALVARDSKERCFIYGSLNIHIHISTGDNENAFIFLLSTLKLEMLQILSPQTVAQKALDVYTLVPS